MEHVFSKKSQQVLAFNQNPLLNDNNDSVMSNRKPIPSGTRFSRLVVIEPGENSGGHSTSLCRCDCGTTRTAINAQLRRGHIKSCGCLQPEAASRAAITHNLSGTREYKIWSSMLTRCRNSKRKSFKYYGGHGISVCERWLKFENFIADMGAAPANCTLDRKNNDGHYEPSNCRWATQAVQSSNRSNTPRLNVFGIEGTLKDLCRHFSLNYHTIYYRVNVLHWNVEKALTEPSRYAHPIVRRTMPR